MKKIKIFLGGYVNFPNAQNINCDNIAKYLDKEKFEVHTMYTSKMPIDKDEYVKQNIHLHKLIHHKFIWYWSKWFVMRLGTYDIYYLPKRESMDTAFVRKYKGKGSVFIASVESVITENENKEFQKYYTADMDASFAISQCIADSVTKYWKCNFPILPLGVVEQKGNFARHRNKIANVVWVGNVIERKRPQLLVQCAMHFPQLSFTMIGDGDLYDSIEQECRQKNIKNIFLTGRIPNEEVYGYMQNSDLLLMTSEYEGLPKVIQEAAQCGIPSIYMNKNYNVDFIEDGVNGYAVANLDQMLDRVQYLLDFPETYQKMSEAAYEIIQKYTWGNLIKDYETYFIRQYENRHNGG